MGSKVWLGPLSEVNITTVFLSSECSFRAVSIAPKELSISWTAFAYGSLYVFSNCLETNIGMSVSYTHLTLPTMDSV